MTDTLRIVALSEVRIASIERQKLLLSSQVKCLADNGCSFFPFAHDGRQAARGDRFADGGFCYAMPFREGAG